MTLTYRFVAVMAAIALCLPACGDSLVGGRCAPGYLAAPHDGGCVRGDASDEAIDARADDGMDVRSDIALDGRDAATDGDVIPSDAMDIATDAPIDGASDVSGGGCDAGFTWCLGVCTDLNVDPANCGVCETACGATDVCRAGACVPRCTAPQIDCSGTCADTTNDPTHCGSCAVACGATEVCTASVCVPRCAAPTLDCGGVCVRPDNDPMNCGVCGRVCAVSEVCTGGTCAARCAAPTIYCAGVCVDPQTDELNCGGCGVVCPSGVCNAGLCRDARVGHVVLIGHNFRRTRNDQDRLVGNAVFLAPSPSPRILSFVGSADATAVMNVDAAIATTAGARTWRRVALSDPAMISASLSIDTYDVMLVFEQSTATDAAIATLATEAGDALGSFARAGGVVIVLDGPTTNAGTYPVMAATGLLSPTGVRNIDALIVTLVPAAATDALAVGVRGSYRAQPTSVSFITTDPYAVFVQGTPPVVLHRAVGP